MDEHALGSRCFNVFKMILAEVTRSLHDMACIVGTASPYSSKKENSPLVIKDITIEIFLPYLFEF